MDEVLLCDNLNIKKGIRGNVSISLTSPFASGIHWGRQTSGISLYSKTLGETNINCIPCMLRIKYKDCPKWKQTLYELLACQQRRNKHCTNTFLQRTAPKSLPRKKNGFRGEKDSRPPLVCEGM